LLAIKFFYILHELLAINRLNLSCWQQLDRFTND
jgi:hypothetical protein